MAAPLLVCPSEGRVARNAPLEGFDFGDQVSDTGSQLAKDWAQGLLPPAAKSFDGEPPAGGELVFIDGDARGTVSNVPAVWPTGFN